MKKAQYASNKTCQFRAKQASLKSRLSEAPLPEHCHFEPQPRNLSAIGEWHSTNICPDSNLTA
jgi:hypothetical protein